MRAAAAAAPAPAAGPPPQAVAAVADTAAAAAAAAVAAAATPDAWAAAAAAPACASAAAAPASLRRPTTAAGGAAAAAQAAARGRRGRPLRAASLLQPPLPFATASAPANMQCACVFVVGGGRGSYESAINAGQADERRKATRPAGCRRTKHIIIAHAHVAGGVVPSSCRRWWGRCRQRRGAADRARAVAAAAAQRRRRRVGRAVLHRCAARACACRYPAALAAIGLAASPCLASRATYERDSSAMRVREGKMWPGIRCKLLGYRDETAAAARASSMQQHRKRCAATRPTALSDVPRPKRCKICALTFLSSASQEAPERLMAPRSLASRGANEAAQARQDRTVTLLCRCFRENWPRFPSLFDF